MLPLWVKTQYSLLLSFSRLRVYVTVFVVAVAHALCPAALSTTANARIRIIVLAFIYYRTADASLMVPWATPGPRSDCVVGIPLALLNPLVKVAAEMLLMVAI